MKFLIKDFTNPIGRRQLKTYYATRNVQLSWANAFSFCKANGMNLVELHSEQEVNQFLTMCSDNSLDYFLHVGGSAEGMTDRLDFYWMTTGERISYSLKYHPAGKNNAGGKERCLSVAKQPNKYTFNDVDCWQHFIWSFVCQQVKDI